MTTSQSNESTSEHTLHRIKSRVGAKAERMLAHVKNLTKEDVFDAACRLFGSENQGFYEENLQKAIEKGRAYNVDHFYIAVLLRNDKLNAGKMLFIFIPRYTCPDPHPNQVVYRIDSKKTILWVLPDPDLIAKYAVTLPDLTNPAFIGLHTFARQYMCGHLKALSKKENQTVLI